MKTGKILQTLMDTGSYKNSRLYQMQYLTIEFSTNSAGGKILISHHTFINLCGLNDLQTELSTLPELELFHAIKKNIKVTLKQRKSQAVNNIQIRKGHITGKQEASINDVIRR